MYFDTASISKTAQGVADGVLFLAKSSVFAAQL
jgi:hypothetical protein